MFLGARAADCAFARKQYRLVQSCKSTAILHAYDAAHYRGGCSSVDDSERVSCFLLPTWYILILLGRITDVSYKVFFDAIEAHGRALLRIPLVSYLQ